MRRQKQVFSLILLRYGSIVIGLVFMIIQQYARRSQLPHRKYITLFIACQYTYLNILHDDRDGLNAALHTQTSLSIRIIFTQLQILVDFIIYVQTLYARRRPTERTESALHLMKSTKPLDTKYEYCQK